MTPSAAQQALANETVRLMYRSFDTDALSELIKIGGEHEAATENPPVELVALNVALRAELERRQMEAVR